MAKLTFKDLAIGDRFDFVNDALPGMTTFYYTCTKASARRYSFIDRGRVLIARVGSIKVEVFHVERAK